MLKIDQIRDIIMAEIHTEVTNFLAKAVEQKPEAVDLESQAREIGLRCGARLLEKAIQLHGNGHIGQTISCNCDEEGLNFIRYDRKSFITATGKITARSAYYHCSICKSSRWPLFERMSLGPGHLSEGARRIAAFAGADRGGFTHSQQLVERLSGISLSASTIERTCEEIGSKIKQQQKYEVERSFKQDPVPITQSARQAVKLLHIATDGTTAPTQAGWREVKTAAIYELDSRYKKKPRACRVSYVSSFEQCEQFGREMWSEAERRGACRADVVVVLGDGAAWIWNQYAMHFPRNRVEILDYFHASEHLSAVAKAYFGETSRKAAKWHEKQSAQLLKQGGANRVLRALKRLKTSKQQAAEIISDNIRYIENNVDRMNYSEYRRKGYHIGSGLAESACKHLVGARLKQSGMTNWSEAGAEAVLRVRVVIENGTFDQYCDKVSRRRLQAAA